MAPSILLNHALSLLYISMCPFSICHFAFDIDPARVKRKSNSPVRQDVFFLLLYVDSFMCWHKGEMLAIAKHEMTIKAQHVQNKIFVISKNL